ncbi:NAD(P)-dependent oxidoreductase [Acetobacter sp. AN02]|uniref:NAD(P)-dependent oxidoreductase n=1 Tax=Acetobacter sp. AN02 TaxID=2894186 RepID=UPI0024341CAC|nr:NAD(P)-dependent oxidoreductase [Acetobacter sp. AN02]MDG6094012.1 NAD(P)-dependent oxidoreductase [Acetobacter sp. AN02]
MSAPMLGFVSVPQAQPEKRSAGDRCGDFDEIYNDFADGEAQEQANRCSQCGVPFCSINCPLGNNIPDWLMLAANDRLEEAYAVSAQTNSFPEICGRICPQDRLCEGNCVIEKGFDSVTIGAIERYITDTAFENGWVKPATPRKESGRSVGIVGAGPAGLAAAERLRATGHEVHVYDRHDRVGGLLIYGIPGFKLEKEIVARRHALLEEQGIRFHLGQGIGSGEGELAFEELRARHDAVLIAVGVYKSRDIGGPGSGLEGIIPALTYLTASNRRSLGDVVTDPLLDASGKDVVVIGGGDTAMDCVRTAIRQGAKSVKCLYRRDKANMPGSAREVKNAEEEGVEFVWLAAPEGFLGEGSVTSVRARRMKLGLPDATGRQSIEPEEDGLFTVKADLVIKALGFDPEPLPEMWKTDDLATSRWGTLVVRHETFETSLPGVFAAGDIVRGASLVVWAIRDGRDAAAQIDQWLEKHASAKAGARMAAE